jgi:uncharacterized protein DUF6484
MRREARHHRIVESTTNEPSGIPCVGRVVGRTPDGRPLVDFPGNAGAPVPARSALAATRAGRGDLAPGVEALLVFDEGDRSRPIVVGLLGAAPGGTLLEDVLTATERPAEAVVDGRRLVLEAHDEVVLRCGQSSITLRKDGTIVIRGRKLTSRASELHKIRGGAVFIN